VARSIAAVSGSSGRNRSVLLLAAVFGILSAVLIFAFLKANGGDSDKINEALNTSAGAESVVVLVRDVQAGEEITSDMLTTQTVPGPALLTGRSTNMEDFVGKVAVQTMYAGEQALTAKVTDFGSQRSISYKVPEGKRSLAVTVPHESWMVGGLPQPGDRIDFLAITAFRVVDPLTGSERPEVVSGIIAEDIEVLAMGQTVVAGAPSADGGSASTGEEGSDDTAREGAISVTLALTPEQAAKIALIDALEDNEGQWRIIVRRKGETETVSGDKNWGLDDIFDFTN
jgi:pilus assembly protein CpaB